MFTGDDVMEKNENYIDKSNRKRLYFFSEISKILSMYNSTNDEVNELINWLYILSNSISEIEPYETSIHYTYNMKQDERVDKNTFRRHVWTQDLRIYSIVASIIENSSWENKDILYDITNNIYHKLDKIIHPDYRPGLDYEEVRYYAEVEYINKEKQKYNEENYNLDYKEEEWRA